MSGEDRNSCRRAPRDPAAAGRNPVRALFRIGSALSLALLLHGPALARVLDDADLVTVERIKPLFTDVLTEISRASQQPGLSSGESDCIEATLRSLLQISEELKSYEYLITIEGRLDDFNDNDALRSVLRFAVDSALKILDTERRRIGDLSDQCSRFPIAAGKTQQAIQFIDATSETLKSVQPRL